MTNKTGCIAHSTPCRPSGVNNPLLFTTNRTDPKFFLWRLHLAWPSHPGHSTIFCCDRTF